MKLIHDKPPVLVALDFKAGTANRYVRRFDTSGAGLGWRVTRTHPGTFDPAVGPPSEAVEQFRVKGI